MDIVLILKHAIIGFIMAFLGLLSPGLLTSTTLNTAIDRGAKEAGKFALGAVFPIFIQAHIALLGAEYFKKHPELIRKFSGIAVFVFLFLALLFLYQYMHRNRLVIERSKFNIRQSFLYGFFVSLINPLAIPFYFTYTTLLEFKGIVILKEPYITIFVLSAMMGAFVILSIYARHASLFLSKIQFVARNFKLILAMIMIVLAISSFIASQSI